MNSIDEIKHLEELSNLEFSDVERQNFINEFETILDFASQISNAKCDKGRYENLIKFENLRDDIAKEGLKQEEVVSNAKEKRNGCFVVPKIVE